MLPRSEINVIKSNLSNALSSKNPNAVSDAVELSTLPRSTDASGGISGDSSRHNEQLKIDGVDWSNVLNPLLDAHESIRMVRTISEKLMAVSRFRCCRLCCVASLACAGWCLTQDANKTFGSRISRRKDCFSLISLTSCLKRCT